jgi:GDPmannose 4,6-dehydratase
MKKALITGITGQDGSYLSKFLLGKGYEIYGAYKRDSNLDLSRLKELGVEHDIKLLPFDLLEFSNIFRTIEKVKPDEIYNLAAQSFVYAAFEQPLLTSNIDALGVLRILETLRTLKPDTKFYQASTSEMFGKVQEIPQKETTPFYPRSPYGIAKLFGHWITVNYKESYNMFACSGILFNHESPLRGYEFITRKVTCGIARIKQGLQDKIVLGNLDPKRDWGYAPEYVEAMWLMLQQDKPDNYVIATGETHSVREFVELAFKYADIDLLWQGKGIEEKGIDKKTGKTLIEVSAEFFRPTEVDILIGDSSKAKKILHWQPRTKFEQLARIMVEADIKRLKK